MSKQDHEHDHHGHHDHQHGHSQPAAGWRPHRDWRFWVAVVLMLVGMAAYVASMDESLRLGGSKPAPPAVPVNGGGSAK